MKTVRWFALGIAGMFFGGLALLSIAATGDLIYQVNEGSCITAPQALCYAQCAKDAGTWSGEVADMVRASAERDGSCASGFRANTVGLKSAAPANLPVGADPVPVVGIVE